MPGLLEEIGQRAGIALLLALLAVLQQVLAVRVEPAVEVGEEGKRVVVEDLLITIAPIAPDLHSGNVSPVSACRHILFPVFHAASRPLA
jgi:hypothetical protein